MGHKAGTRHDGGQGTLRARRSAANKAATHSAMKQLESEARRVVRELAQENSKSAVEQLVEIMEDQDQLASARVLAAREVLKLAEVYAPAPHGGDIPLGEDGRPHIVINLLSVGAELPRQITVEGLPSQKARTLAPATQPLDPEIGDAR